MLNRFTALALVFSFGVVVHAPIAIAACVADGTTMTCTGDLSSGVALDSPYEKLVIKDLTAPIGGLGISLQSGGTGVTSLNLEVDADLGSQPLFVAGVIGITAATAELKWNSGSVSVGSVAVRSRGSVTSVDSYGIFAQSFANAHVIFGPPNSSPITVVVGDVTVDVESATGGTAGIHAYSFVNAFDYDSTETMQAQSGNIKVTASGDVIATRDASRGVDVMSDSSVSGGPLTPLVTATGGSVDIDVNNVTALGTDSYAVNALLSAWVGSGQNWSSTLGDATITTRGEISATGAGGIGIFVKNVLEDNRSPSSSYGDYEVNVLSGSSVTGGSGGGIGIYGEGFGTITNHGTISALSGLAISSTVATTDVENYGVITGSVGLSLGANAFNNHASGIFNIGNSAYVGTGTLTNDGIVSPHGAGTIGQSTVTGNYVQSASGKLVVDADWSAAGADLLNVTGNATLAGTVIVIPHNSPLKSGANAPLQIVGTTGSVTNAGMTAQDTATVDYSLQFDPQAVYLTAFVDFRGIGGGLNRNQTAIGTAVNTLTSGGTPAPFLPVTNALMTLPTGAALANAYDQLSPEVYNYEKIDTLFAAEQFSADLMSCKVDDAGGYAFIREGQCIWARARARFLDLGTTRDSIGADTTVGSFSGGGQFAIAPDWRLGVAAGYDNVSLDTGTGAAASGDRAHVGAVLKYNPGPWLVTGAVAGGWSVFDTQRNMAFGGFAGSAAADTDVDYFAGRLHLAYLVDAGSWYVMPMLDGVATRLDFGGARESGGNGAALLVAGDHDTILALAPAVEFGTQMNLTAGTVLRPFIRAGVTWRDGDDLGLAGAFAVTPAVTFATDTALDEVLADVSAGMDLINANGAVLRLQYDGRFGEDTQQSSASLKGSVPF